MNKKITQLRWLAATLMLVAAMVMPSTAWAQTMYTVYDTETATLTFKYDDSKPESTETQKVYDVPTSSSRPGWITNHQYDIKTVVFDASFADARPTTCYYWFYKCEKLTNIQSIKNLNTSEVTDMSYMFSNCLSLESLDLSSFNTAKVTNMKSMFYYCSKLTSLNLSNFNTAKVTNMERMFQNCSKLESLDLSSFNTAEVTTMFWMFYECSSLKYLTLSSNFNTPKVTNMNGMFNSCSSLTSIDLSSFNTAKVTNMDYMFHHCSQLTSLDLSNFNTAEVTSMSNMVSSCSSLTSLDLSNFNTAKVTNMGFMFRYCSQLTTIYVSGSFATGGVTYSNQMFEYCYNLVGAKEYDSGIIDKTGANYRTGYFTYGIVTADDLKAFAQSVNGTYTPADGETATAYPNLCAGLMKDIALTADDIIEPMGKNGSYTGTFDGRGHSISGLKINSTNNSLFANNSGTIKNLGVVNAQIAEGSNGSICQTNSGTIESCFFTGTTEGTTSPSGAICQTNSGTIANCYYLADSETDAIEGTTAKTAAQFKSGAVAWLLNGSSADGEWGQQLGTEDYPVWGGAKVYQCSPCTAVYSNDENEVTAEHTVSYDNGFGTCSVCGDKLYQPATLNGSQYEIGNAGQLCWFAGLVNGTLTDGTPQNTTAKGVLTDNIDLTGISNWTPIGNESNKFGGTFDGKNFKVQHLSITQQGSNTGLFGYASGATMQNICIDGNFTLTTTSYTEGYGSIAGCVVSSTISNCHSSVNFTINTEMDASVNCIGHIGGIVGKMYETSSTDSNVSGCSYSGTINLGNNKVNVAAGIAGYAIYSNVPITNCSFTGTIHSECEDALIMGGIFGYTRTGGNVKVTNCLQAGTLEKPGNSSLTGILIGQINTGYGANAVTNNYYTASTFNVIGSATGTPTTTPATQCTANQLLSGEICYLLNGSSPYGGWGQQLAEDDCPIPGSGYKVIRAARGDMDANGDYPYWATFSNLNSNAELLASTGEITVYNATVSDGKLTLTKRSDKKVASGEGVLLKANSEYVNAKDISDEVSAAATGDTHLVATPKDAGIINAETGYTLYRFTYNNVASKECLGFYLGVVGESKDGSQLKATPGKAYLKVSTQAATEASTVKLASGFAFGGDNGEITGIECITITDESTHGNSVEGIFDLQGRKVSKLEKGLYINNGKKVIIK